MAGSSVREWYQLVNYIRFVYNLSGGYIITIKDMSTSDSCKADSASKSNNDGVCELEEKLQNLSTAGDNVSVCANCGKEGDDVNNICNKCKKATYCNAACKKRHRHKHKKECEEHLKLAAEHAAKLHDEKLFEELHQSLEIVRYALYVYQI